VLEHAAFAQSAERHRDAASKEISRAKRARYFQTDSMFWGGRRRRQPCGFSGAFYSRSGAKLQCRIGQPVGAELLCRRGAYPWVSPLSPWWYNASAGTARSSSLAPRPSPCLAEHGCFCRGWAMQHCFFLHTGVSDCCVSRYPSKREQHRLGDPAQARGPIPAGNGLSLRLDGCRTPICVVAANVGLNKGEQQNALPRRILQPTSTDMAKSATTL
jgi:hypothetical protein